jgi:hypothetical protein
MLETVSQKWCEICWKILTTFPRTMTLAVDIIYGMVGMTPQNADDSLASVSQKRRKFRELAESRTNKAIDSVLRIGNLSNRQVYEFEDSEVRKIIRALRDAVASVETRFGSPKSKQSNSFKL